MKAAEIMTEEVRVVQDDEPIATALDLLAGVEARHLPVVDRDGDLVGMLSDRDLRALLGQYDEDAVRFAVAWNEARMTVASVMTRDPIAVTDDADVEEVVDLLIDQKIGALPVTDDAKKVLGIISYIDVLRAWQREHEAFEVPALLPTTAALEDRARAANPPPRKRGPRKAAAKTAPAKSAGRSKAAAKRMAG